MKLRYALEIRAKATAKPARPWYTNWTVLRRYRTQADAERALSQLPRVKGHDYRVSTPDGGVIWNNRRVAA